MRMIAGLEKPTAGQIYIGGAEVTELPPRKRGVSMVFQSYALYPHMNVFNNIAFPLQGTKPREKIQQKNAIRDKGRKHRAPVGDRYAARSPSAAAFRWAAATCRHRPRHGHATSGAACSMSPFPTSMPSCAPTPATNSRNSSDLRTLRLIFVTHDQIEAMGLRRSHCCHVGRQDSANRYATATDLR